MNQAVEYVAFFATEGINAPYPLFTSRGLNETPIFRVMQLFSHLQHNLIPIETQGNSINMYATQDDAHQTVSLLLINNSATTQFAQVSSQNQFFGWSNWHDLRYQSLLAIVSPSLHCIMAAEQRLTTTGCHLSMTIPQLLH